MIHSQLLPPPSLPPLLALLLRKVGHGFQIGAPFTAFGTSVPAYSSTFGFPQPPSGSESSPGMHALQLW